MYDFLKKDTVFERPSVGLTVFRTSTQNNNTHSNHICIDDGWCDRQNTLLRSSWFGKQSYLNEYCTLWGWGVFKRGIKNQNDFCLRINMHKENDWILSFGLMASCPKVPKFDFRSQFSMSKIILIFLNFFSLNQFLRCFITKMMPYLYLTARH